MQHLRTLSQAFIHTDEVAARIEQAESILRKCRLCGNACGTDRTRRAGPCGIAATAWIASYGPHHGEEDCLRGWAGSGTIFFSGCNMHCLYCQNYDISQHIAGVPVSAPELAQIMLSLQHQGCHNINLVSPTHVAALLVPAIILAAKAGLRIPIVYNTGGYDSLQALALMEGLIDIYMPDMKYADAAIAETLSGIKDYPRVNRAAVKEMHRQVGDLQLDAQGLAQRGLLVRHLVLPGGLAGTPEIVRFIAEEISPHTYINIMDQYRPSYRAREYATSAHPLNRRPTSTEISAALRAAQDAGLHRFDHRMHNR